MPAVTIKADGRAPARARRRPPRRWVRVRPAAPLDPDRRQRLGTPGRRSNSKRRDCRSGRGGRAVRPLGYGLLRPPGRRDGTTTRPRTAGWSSYSPARPTSANRTGATEALPVWTEELRDPVAAGAVAPPCGENAGRAGRPLRFTFTPVAVGDDLELANVVRHEHEAERQRVRRDQHVVGPHKRHGKSLQRRPEPAPQADGASPTLLRVRRPTDGSALRASAGGGGGPSVRSPCRRSWRARCRDRRRCRGTRGR